MVINASTYNKCDDRQTDRQVCVGEGEGAAEMKMKMRRMIWKINKCYVIKEKNAICV